MIRQEAEKLITEYAKPIYGFALKRCKNAQDAEDLSQEIVLKAFRALLVRDDIVEPSKFIWTVAHNSLSNYYRDTTKNMIGVSIDDVAELIADPLSDPFAEIEADDEKETISRLQSEIAYLSKLQRQIVIAYYFENRKQSEIATRLGVPIGTVKWHLFEAKKELKRGMDNMRQASELKFNPIKFNSYGTNGSIAEKSPDEFFRSSLAQNICYCVRNSAMTINEIAEALGVSPVYVESEAENLEEYGFLSAQQGKYIANFIILEPTNELLATINSMYKQAANLFANDLYDELVRSGLLDDPNIICHHKDHNFILWSLIPYIAAWSGEKLKDNRISFNEVATIRPDGSHNIVHAEVLPDNLTFPADFVKVNNWYGPMWNGTDNGILWQIDSDWTDRGANHGFQYYENAVRVLSLYAREKEDRLSKDEYLWLAEHGFVKTSGDYDGLFKSAWQIVILENADIKNRLLEIGDKLKEKYKDEFAALKAPYTKAMLEATPKHLRKIQEYNLQSVFHSDSTFLYHCVKTLLDNGKLVPPTEEQRKSLTTLITC